jgi:tRNA dimethylallyltransferase
VLILLGATGQESWNNEVVEPCVDAVKRFLSEGAVSLPSTTSASDGTGGRELWTQYVCEVTNTVTLELYVYV